MSILRSATTWGCVQHWMAGRRSLPAAVARIAADYIAARCEVGAALVAELLDYADKAESVPKHLHGFCAVDEETGRDRRGNWQR